jgi:diguanylate cyclase (GGDEF)-like protein
MPAQSPEAFVSENRDRLLEELESLGRLMHEETRGENSDNQPAVAVGRIFSDLSAEEWPKLAQKYGLQDWLVLPVSGGAYPMLEELQRMVRELAYRGEHDPLTGLLNRRAFEQRIVSEMERAKRRQNPICLALIDLDDFKLVNDRYGHPAGDQVLVSLAQTLLDSTRRYDVASRIGGEEFGLFLPDTGQIKARIILNRLLEKVREKDFQAGEETFGVTCSVGAACWKARPSPAVPDLYEAADQSLYEAKNSGKDTVRIAKLPESGAPAKSLVLSDEKKFLFTGGV